MENFELGHDQKKDPNPPVNLKLMTEKNANVISTYKLSEKDANFYFNTEEKAKILAISDEQKNTKINPLKIIKGGTLNEVQSSKTNEKIEQVANFATYLAMLSAPFLGVNLAAAALNLTMIIQLFHKTILFNTKYGPKLEYFLIASSNVLDSIEEEEEGKRSFNPWKINKRLVDYAELNTYTIDEYPFELLFLFGFVILRGFRLLIIKYVFERWERNHGRNIYQDAREIELEKKEREKERKKVQKELTIKKKKKNVTDIK